MIETNNVFLTSIEENSFKSGYQKFKDLGEIDSNISYDLDLLNSVDGLSTLFSCSSHPENNKLNSYLVIKFKEELTYPITEALYYLEDKCDIEIEWIGSCYYDILGIETKVEGVVTIRGNTDYSYFKKFADLIVDWFYEIFL